jgi:uncharacterized protein
MSVSLDSRPVKWLEIALFYAIAVGLSAPFRLNWVDLNEILPLPAAWGIFYRIFRAIGPMVGFLIMFYLFKSQATRQMSFFGFDRFWSLASLLIFPVCFTFFGIENDRQIEPHFFGLQFGLMLITYALFEEYGWRGYLQHALNPLPRFLKIFLVALMWYAWHLHFFTGALKLQGQLIFFGSILLGCWGLEVVSNKTRSMLMVAAIHLSFNLFAESPLDQRERLITFGLALPIWILAIRSAEKRAAKALVSP